MYIAMDSTENNQVLRDIYIYEITDWGWKDCIDNSDFNWFQIESWIADSRSAGSIERNLDGWSILTDDEYFLEIL